MMRAAVAFLLACQPVLAQENPFPQVAAAYLVQVDREVLWEKQADARLPPASLTKLMTALVVLEAKPLDDTVVIRATAARASGSRLHLLQGSRFSVEHLLQALLLHSANDACLALAEHVAGSERHFVARMNARAVQMGLRDTHFANPCGHDAAGHYSSARDLSRLAGHTLAMPFVRATAALPLADIASLDGKSRFHLVNKNALIGRYPGIAGLKTGYTLRAGKCLIAYAKRDRTEVLLVLLNASQRWWDAVDLLDLAFRHAGE